MKCSDAHAVPASLTTLTFNWFQITVSRTPEEGCVIVHEEAFVFVSKRKLWHIWETFLRVLAVKTAGVEP